uniref:Fatty acid desaturase domain-containing protein n=1 Tax=Vannella robusta TaxID=1487602 RepID=A0A7S4HLU2_9EUKA|mmetsp:Transcript_126/g.162  ORF Transcript_126/g.162 Transcript_126/m.162 type:complete len:349 (+) Transcript_126:89-1135(+)
MESIKPHEKNPYQPRINSIRKVIYSEDKRLREKYSWLQHQNALGMAWFVGSLVSMGIISALYINGVIAWYVALIIMGVPISFLHELEHDLIHDMYFKEHKWIQHFMFGVIWVSKLNANPWWRKPMHLKHHKTSGQVDDIEERLIGLGLPFGLKRILVTLSPLGSFLVMNGVAEDSKKMDSKPLLNIIRTSFVNLPVLLPSHLALLAILFPSMVSETVYNFCWNVCMLMFFPNMIRQSCLQIVSTGVHYYGDIPMKNVFFQNQVIDHWTFYPMQLFCFNFGATHILHHYVTRQPFYLRQMCAPGVMNEFKKQGVRFNDLEIYKRDHRYNKVNTTTKQQPSHTIQLAVGA